MKPEHAEAQWVEEILQRHGLHARPCIAGNQDSGRQKERWKHPLSQDWVLAACSQRFRHAAVEASLGPSPAAVESPVWRQPTSPRTWNCWRSECWGLRQQRRSSWTPREYALLIAVRPCRPSGQNSRLAAALWAGIYLQSVGSDGFRFGLTPVSGGLEHGVLNNGNWDGDRSHMHLEGCDRWCAGFRALRRDVLVASVVVVVVVVVAASIASASAFRQDMVISGVHCTDRLLSVFLHQVACFCSQTFFSSPCARLCRSISRTNTFDTLHWSCTDGTGTSRLSIAWSARRTSFSRVEDLGVPWLASDRSDDATGVPTDESSAVVLGWTLSWMRRNPCRETRDSLADSVFGTPHKCRYRTYLNRAWVTFELQSASDIKSEWSRSLFVGRRGPTWRSSVWRTLPGSRCLRVSCISSRPQRLRCVPGLGFGSRAHSTAKTSTAGDSSFRPSNTSIRRARLSRRRRGNTSCRSRQLSHRDCNNCDGNSATFQGWLTSSRTAVRSSSESIHWFHSGFAMSLEFWLDALDKNVSTLTRSAIVAVLVLTLCKTVEEAILQFSPFHSAVGCFASDWRTDASGFSAPWDFSLIARRQRNVHLDLPRCLIVPSMPLLKYARRSYEPGCRC